MNERLMLAIAKCRSTVAFWASAVGRSLAWKSYWGKAGWLRTDIAYVGSSRNPFATGSLNCDASALESVWLDMRRCERIPLWPSYDSLLVRSA